MKYLHPHQCSNSHVFHTDNPCICVYKVTIGSLSNADVITCCNITKICFSESGFGLRDVFSYYIFLILTQKRYMYGSFLGRCSSREMLICEFECIWKVAVNTFWCISVRRINFLCYYINIYSSSYLSFYSKYFIWSLKIFMWDGWKLEPNLKSRIRLI